MGGPGRSPFWRTPEESCKGLGLATLKINTKHTQPRCSTRRASKCHQCVWWHQCCGGSHHFAQLGEKRSTESDSERRPPLGSAPLFVHLFFLCFSAVVPAPSLKLFLFLFLFFF